MNETTWYVRTKNGASGPYSTQQLKEFASNGKLPRQASISKSDQGPWSIAENARGLFPEVIPEVVNDEEIRAIDFVPNVVKNSINALTELRTGGSVPPILPNVVKNSTNALTSAVSGISKSLVSQVKRVESGLAAKADSAISSINSLCADGQDPVFVAKMSSRVSELCTKTEEILYIAVQ